jgi:hypothetical protein
MWSIIAVIAAIFIPLLTVIYLPDKKDNDGRKRDTSTGDSKRTTSI